LIELKDLERDLLNSFKLSILNFTLKCEDEINLPIYKGSTLRGSFGKILWKIICTKKDIDCNNCINKYICIYSQIFKTPNPLNSKIFSKIKYIPHPFIIEPPLEIDKLYLKGNEIEFKLILFGNIINFYHYFIIAFEELGKNGIGKSKGHFKLKHVIDEMNNSILIDENKNSFLPDSPNLLPLSNLYDEFLSQINLNEIKLNFITPTRIVYNGKLIDDLPFHIFIKNLIRRIWLILYFHHKIDFTLNYKELIDSSLNVDIKNKNLYWYDWERYSSTQNTKIKLGGFKGVITYTGDLKKFLPLIFIGSYIHIGKQTSFGLGKYEIIKEVENGK